MEQVRAVSRHTKVIAAASVLVAEHGDGAAPEGHRFEDLAPSPIKKAAQQECLKETHKVGAKAGKKNRDEAAREEDESPSIQRIQER